MLVSLTFRFRSFTSTLLAGCRVKPPLAVSTLQAMKSLSRTLTAVSSMVELSVPELSGLLMPDIHKTGMGSLPDEILVSIFESAFDLAGRERNEVTWSIVHVCRRYRRLAFKTPRLWTFMKFTAGDDVDVELHLKLSRHKALSIEFDCDKFEEGKLEDIMRSVKPGAERLEELTIRAMEENYHICTFLEHLREEYIDVNFRMLQALHMELWQPDWCYYEEEEEDIEGDAKLKFFFKNWRTPNLRELGLSNQTQVNDFIDSSHITCLHLSFGSPMAYGRGMYRSHWCSDRIVDYLQNFKVLQELSLKLEFIDFERGSRELVSIPTVTKLSIDVWWCWPASLANLADALEFPNVEHLNIRLLTFQEDIQEWLEPFCKTSKFGGEKVRHLTLNVEIEEGRCSIVKKFLQYYYNVRHLHLKGRDFELPDLNTEEFVFDLLRIEDSNRIDKSFLDGLAGACKAYKDSREAEGIGRLEFINCPYVGDVAFRDHTDRG